MNRPIHSKRSFMFSHACNGVTFLFLNYSFRKFPPLNAAAASRDLIHTTVVLRNRSFFPNLDQILQLEFFHFCPQINFSTSNFGMNELE